MLSRAESPTSRTSHIKFLDFLCANNISRKEMFKTKTHPYQGKHIREGYRDQAAKPRPQHPIVKTRWEKSSSINSLHIFLNTRSCTDVICLLVFLCFLAAWVLVAVLALRSGDIRAMLYPTDSMVMRTTWLYKCVSALFSIQSNYRDIWFTLECLKWLLDQFNFVCFQFEGLL